MRALFAYIFGWCAVPRCWRRRIYGEHTLLCMGHLLLEAAVEYGDENDDAELIDLGDGRHALAFGDIGALGDALAFGDAGHVPGLGIELADDLEKITLRPREGLRFDQVQREKKRQRKGRRG